MVLEETFLGFGVLCYTNDEISTKWLKKWAFKSFFVQRVAMLVLLKVIYNGLESGSLRWFSIHL